MGKQPRKVSCQHLHHLIRWLIVSCWVLVSAGCMQHGYRDYSEAVVTPVAFPTVQPAKSISSYPDQARPPVADITLVHHQAPGGNQPPHHLQESAKAELLPPPQALAATCLTLDQAIHLCLVNDPKLRAGFEIINQAHADALTASLKPNPILWTDIQLLPLTRPFTVKEQGGPPQQDVQISFPIDWLLFGKRAAAMVSAAKGVQVSEAEYANLVRERVTQVSLAYHDLVEARGLVQVLHQEVHELGQIASHSQAAVKAGTGTVTELHRIQLQVLKSRRMLREAEALVANNRAKLCLYLGEACCDPAWDVEETLAPPLPLLPLCVDECLALALQQRPDLQALRWKLAQAHADVEVERTKAYPTVTPTLGYTRQYQRKAIGFPDADSWMVSLEMPLPFYNRNQGGRAKAASLAVQRQYELQVAEWELRQEIETLLREWQTARANEATAQEQVRLAAQIRDQIARAREAGKEVSLLDLLEAQREYHEALRTHLTARADCWRASVKLNAALGQQVIPHGKTPCGLPQARIGH